MSILINNYPIFEDNQVLTSGQLNQLHKYLDQQTRLTRSCLIGMGIACGLELEVANDSNTSLIIHEGLGISSEGFLIKLCPENKSCTTVKYREYNLPEGTVYTPFQDAIFQQDIELFELLTNEAKVDGDEQVDPLTDDFLKDKVVLLFLECLDNDLKSCLGKSCDELGVDRIFTLRKLLINVADLSKVIRRTNGGRQDDLFLKKFDLRDISMPRVFFEEVHTIHYFPFALRYIQAINQVFKPLTELLNATYVVYEPILSKVYGENPFTKPDIQKVFGQLEEYLNGGLIQPSWWGVQYVYDFLKDLILAYREFKDCAYDLMIQCCPDMTRFPRHLMLGKVFEIQRDPCAIDPYKHPFTQPPIYNLQGQLLKKTISLHKRMVLLLEKFSFERLQSVEKIPERVTPSCEKKSLLSKRSIPFYYDSKSSSKFDALENLELEWSYDRNHRQCQLLEKESNALNLSYDNNSMLPEAKTPLTTPLHFDLDQLNFLRLEGFQGKDMQKTVSDLVELKTKANLDFDVKTIYFGDLHATDDKRIRLPDCVYHDLQPDYAIWRGKLLYFLGSFSRLITGSRFLQRESKEKNVSNIMSPKDTSELYEELNSVNKINRNLNNNNWMRTIDEVHYKTKTDNRSEWIKKEKEAASTGGSSSASASVDGLHAKIMDCLIDIRNRTPEDIRQFEMTPWLEAYKCPLVLYIEYVKLRAGQIPNNTNLTKINVVIRLIAALQELLRNLFIYPYIDIRVLWNTLEGRRKVFYDEHSFFNFLGNHPGLEHKAGVAQGGTFVLLYQGGYTERANAKLKRLAEIWLKETKNTAIDIDDFFQFNEEGQGKILADFTLPYKCCDPCTDIGLAPNLLDPLAVPICEIVPTRLNSEKESSIEYEALEERILHSMYEPERYRITLTDQEGKYGVAKLNPRPFPFDDKKQIQTFLYTVDQKKVLAASVNNESAYLIDTFVYQVEKVGQETTFIDEAEITVIVPIIPKGDSPAIGFKGRVYYIDENKIEFGIPKAEVWTTLGKNTFKSISDDKGFYTLTDPSLVNGTYILRIVAEGFNSAIYRNVVVKNGVTTQDVELIAESKLNEGLKGLIDKIGISEKSKEAVLLAEEYAKSGRLYREVMKNAIRKEKENVKTLIATEKAIVKFTEEEAISEEELNMVYTENRDKLLKELEESKDKITKINRSNALKVLTNSYMDRVIVNEGKEIGTASVKTLKESAGLIKKAGISMDTEMKEWSKSKTRVLGKEFVSGITKNFKA